MRSRRFNPEQALPMLQPLDHETSATTEEDSRLSLPPRHLLPPISTPSTIPALSPLLISASSGSFLTPRTPCTPATLLYSQASCSELESGDGGEVSHPEWSPEDQPTPFITSTRKKIRKPSHPENPGAFEFYRVVPIPGFELAPAPQQPGAAAFPHKVYNMLGDVKYQDVAYFSGDGTTFTVVECPRFTQGVLPKHFKHSTFASFVRQLNMYGFSKLNKAPRGLKDAPPYWEFSHPNFVRGRLDLLTLVERQKPATSDDLEHDIEHAAIYKPDSPLRLRRPPRRRKVPTPKKTVRLDPSLEALLTDKSSFRSFIEDVDDFSSPEQTDYSQAMPTIAVAPEEDHEKRIQREYEGRLMHLQTKISSLSRQVDMTRSKSSDLLELIAQMHARMEAAGLPSIDLPLRLFAEYRNEHPQLYSTALNQAVTAKQQSNMLEVPAVTESAWYCSPTGSIHPSPCSSNQSLAFFEDDASLEPGLPPMSSIWSGLGFDFGGNTYSDDDGAQKQYQSMQRSTSALAAFTTSL